MRILFLSQVLPYPLDAGPKTRSYFVLRHLVRQHQVTLLTFMRDTDRAQDVAHLAAFCHAVHTVNMRRNRVQDIRYLLQSLLDGPPFLILRDRVPAMAAKIEQIGQLQQFDAIHADQLWMAQYALLARAVCPQARLVLDQHNAVHLIPQRLAQDTTNPLKKGFLQHEARALAAYETEICRQFDHVVWVSAVDRQAVATLSDKPVNRPGAWSVIPICADLTADSAIVPAALRPRITFIGGMHWPPNAEGILWFANHVFPQIRVELPGAILTVIGRDPPSGLEGPGIEVTGYLDDPTPYLAETGVFIVPLHAGGGMRVKILDAWRWGLPVVSTSIGAEGIEIHPEVDILTADTASAFASAVIRVVQDRSLADRLGESGRQAAENRYDWRAVYPAWDSVYSRLHHTPQLTPLD